MASNIEAPTPLVFDEMGVFWEEIAEKSKTESQIKLVKENIKSKGRILDLSCGTGRHSVPLTKEGYKIVGLDVSASLLRLAKKKADRENVDLPLIRGDMRYLPFKADSIKAIFSLDTSFGYLSTDQEDKQALQDLFRILKKTGILLLDVFNWKYEKIKGQRGITLTIYNYFFNLFKPLFLIWPGTLYKLFSWREYPSFYLIQKRTINSKRKMLYDLWIILKKEHFELKIFRHKVRLYSLNKLKNMLKQTGYVIENFYGNYKKQALTVDSHRLIVIARKN